MSIVNWCNEVRIENDLDARVQTFQQYMYNRNLENAFHTFAMNALSKIHMR